MTSSKELIWRIPVVLAAVGSLGWNAPSFVRHQAGIVVLETSPISEAYNAPNQASINIGTILDAALFGAEAQNLPPSEPETASRPSLVLHGIFASTSEASTALLDVDGIDGLYRTGMEVAAGLELTGISRDFVTLQDAEGVITLHFDEADVTTTADASLVGASPQSLMARMGNDLVVPARYERPGKPETTAEYIDYWRHRIKKNPQLVLDEIGLKPTEQGYVIADRHDVGVRLAGLKSGDLVRSVNGRAIGNPNEDRRFYDAVAAEGFARLEVERGGKTISFSFPLR